MATLIHNSTPTSRTPTFKTTGCSTYRNTTEHFFYSNNPEELAYAHTADSGKWLCRETVSGTVQLYTWHHNKVSVNGVNKSINSTILIYNPNSFAVDITISNQGVTSMSYNTTGFSDYNAWENYVNSSSAVITVQSGQYYNIFNRQIPYNYVFGVVAKIQTKRSGTSTVAGVTLFDIAYVSNSAGATACAASTDPLRRRGNGNGFYQTLQFGTLEFANSTPQAYKFAASLEGVFGGDDCSYISDESGQASGLLEGGFGQIFVVRLPIKNNFSTSKTFKIFLGSIGGSSFPFAYLGNDLAKYGQTDALKYIDIVNLGSIGAGETLTEPFSIVIPASSATPYIIGAYPV